MSLVAARLKVPAGLDRLSDLAVEVLDAVGGVDRAAQVGGQREERGDVVSALTPGVGDHRVALAPRLVERLEGLLGGVGVDGAVDRPRAAHARFPQTNSAAPRARGARSLCCGVTHRRGRHKKGGTGGRPVAADPAQHTGSPLFALAYAPATGSPSADRPVFGGTGRSRGSASNPVQDLTVGRLALTPPRWQT